MKRQRVTRRDFLRWSAVASGATIITACGATPTPAATVAPAEAPTATTAAVEEVQPTAAPAEKVKLRWLTEGTSLFGQEVMKVMDSIIADMFVSQHPEFEISIEEEASGWQEKTVTAMIAGDGPDVFEAWPAIFHEWVQRDLIEDLQPFVDRDFSQETVDDFTDTQWDTLLMSGIRIAIPMYTDLRFIIYNKDIFDGNGVAYPPADGVWDHNQYIEMASKLTLDTDGDGALDLWGSQPLGAGGWFIWPRLFGGDYVDPADNTKCTIGSDGCLEAFWFIWDNQWKSDPNPLARPEQIESMWSYDAITAEVVAMTEAGCYPGMLVTQIDDAFKWDIVHLPRGPKGRHTLIDADGWSIWKGSKQKEAAWTLIEFLSGLDYQRKVVVETGGLVPTRKSILGDFLTILRNQFPTLADVRLETIVEILNGDWGGNVHWFKNHLAAMEIISPALETVFDTGSEDPDYFKQIEQQVNESQQA